MRSLRRDLFERRLWPLAIVIVAAIAAVPFLLHDHPKSVAIAPPPAVTGSPQAPLSGTHHSAVDTHRATPTSRTRDPFQEGGAGPATTHHAPASATSATTTPQAPSTPSATTATPATSTPATSTPATTPSATTTPVVSTPPVVTTTHGGQTKNRTTRARSWDIYSVDLRIGAPGSPVTHRDIARLTPLPSERAPQAMYMGVTDHGRRAVFALGAGVEVRAIGAGHSSSAACSPSRVDCALVVVPAGRSIALRYVSQTGALRTLVLRLTRITARLTRSASAARTARQHVSKVGLCELKLGDPIGFFDPAQESVTIPSTAACRRDKSAVPFPGSLGAGSSVRG